MGHANIYLLIWLSCPKGRHQSIACFFSGLKRPERETMPDDKMHGTFPSRRCMPWRTRSCFLVYLQTISQLLQSQP